MRKIFTLLLLLCLSINIFTACDNPERKAIIESTDIAKLSLITYDGKGESVFGLMNLGHAFLSIENTSDSNIKINNITLEPEKCITVGTWSILDHFGVWYNVESNYIKDYNKYDGRLSITIGIDSEDIDAIASEIIARDKWRPLTNCSHFALNVYNSVASDTEKIKTPLIYTPTYLAKEIKKFDTYETNIELITEEKFGYFDDAVYTSYTLSEVEV